MSVPTIDATILHPRELEERWMKMRSHKRAIASLRFRVEWEEENKRRCANGITVDVSHSGCMAVVGADLPLRRKLRVVLPEQGRSAQGEVVWRGHEAWDVGIALSDPDPAFWGVKI
jgi:PilZ domain